MNDHDKRQEFFQYLTKIKQKMRSDGMQGDEVNQHMVKNLEIAQVWLEYH